jgi:hypothetical protein
MPLSGNTGRKKQQMTATPEIEKGESHLSDIQKTKSLKIQTHV